MKIRKHIKEFACTWETGANMSMCVRAMLILSTLLAFGPLHFDSNIIYILINTDSNSQAEDQKLSNANLP